MPYTIPVIKQALAINPNIKVYMLPWSPPGWMKTSDSMLGESFITTYYASLANYFVKTVQADQAQNIPIYAVSPMICFAKCFRVVGAKRLIYIWSTRTPLAGPTERQRHGLFRFVYIGLIAIGGILVIQAAVR